MAEGRRKKEEGRRKKEEGRRKKEEAILTDYLFFPNFSLATLELPISGLGQVGRAGCDWLCKPSSELLAKFLAG